MPVRSHIAVLNKARAVKQAARREPILKQLLIDRAAGKPFWQTAEFFGILQDSLRHMAAKEKLRDPAGFGAKFDEAEQQCKRVRLAASGGDIVTTKQICEHYKIHSFRFYELISSGRLSVQPFERRPNPFGNLWSRSAVEAAMPNGIRLGYNAAPQHIDDRPGFPGRYVRVTARVEIEWIKNGCIYLPPKDDGSLDKIHGFKLETTSLKRRALYPYWYANETELLQVRERLRTLARHEEKAGFISHVKAARLAGIGVNLCRNILSLAKRYLGHKVDSSERSVLRRGAVRIVVRHLVNEGQWLHLWGKVVELANDNSVHCEASARRAGLKLPHNLTRFRKRCPYLDGGRPIRPATVMGRRLAWVGGTKRRWLVMRTVYLRSDLLELQEGWLKANEKAPVRTTAVAKKQRGMNGKFVLVPRKIVRELKPAAPAAQAKSENAPLGRVELRRRAILHRCQDLMKDPHYSKTAAVEQIAKEMDCTPQTVWSTLKLAGDLIPKVQKGRKSRSNRMDAIDPKRR